MTCRFRSVCRVTSRGVLILVVSCLAARAQAEECRDDNDCFRLDSIDPRKQHEHYVDPKKARASYRRMRRACANGDGRSCFDLGTWENDARLVRRACALDWVEACHKLAEQSLAATPKRAVQLLEHTCRLRDVWACLSLYGLYSGDERVGPPNPRKAARALHRACKINPKEYWCDHDVPDKR